MSTIEVRNAAGKVVAAYSDADDDLDLCVEVTMICRWCGDSVYLTDLVDVWAHQGTGYTICAGYRKVDGTGRVSETWAEPTLWDDGER